MITPVQFLIGPHEMPAERGNTAATVLGVSTFAVGLLLDLVSPPQSYS